MLGVGRVADLKCEDVQDLIVPLDFVSETLFFLVSSRVWEGRAVKNLYENESY